MANMLKEFQEFAMKSNFVDMATGIIIGGAAGTVVKSLVSDIIMPPIGYLMGGISFTDLSLPIGQGFDGKDVLIKYGSFIDNIISFLIIMGAIFMLIKVMNTAKARFEKEQVEAAAAEPPRHEVLLEEIRDALVKK